MMKNNYVYLDNAGIMHGVVDESTAKEYGRGGRYVETSLAVSGGYVFEDEKKAFVYADEKKFLIGGNAKGGTEVTEMEFSKKMPASHKLYLSLVPVTSKEELYSKYNFIFAEMGTEDDLGVCLDKLVYTAKNLGNPEREVYSNIPKGVADYVWECLLADVESLQE